MNLCNLQRRIALTDNSDFLELYQTETLSECKTVESVIEKLENIFLEADKYAERNELKYKYIQLAKNYLWEGLTVESESFIYQGFEAQVQIDLSEKLEDIKLFVTIQNNNVATLKEGQRIEITEDFIEGLNGLQQAIFLESLEKVQQRAIKVFRKVWIYEQERIDKWVKTTSIKLKGN